MRLSESFYQVTISFEFSLKPHTKCLKKREKIKNWEAGARQNFGKKGLVKK